MVGRGMKQFLQAHALLDEVFAVKNARECFEVIEKLGMPAVAVIDFWLTEGTSNELIKKLLLMHPSIAILAISGDTNPEINTTVRQLGVQGFVDKQASPEQFNQAVLAILSGMTWFEVPVLEPSAHVNSRDMPISAASLGLSSRQAQILELVLQGLSNKKIAQILNLSDSTIKEHVTGILTKLSVSNRIEAITKLRGRRLVRQ